MALQQQQKRPQAPRQISFSKPVAEVPAPARLARNRPLDGSQDWILFSPTQRDDTTQSGTSQTPRTATHRSDFGSLETHVRSQPANDVFDGDATCEGTEVDDENAELDSLDDGLHAFHHPFSATSIALDQSGGTVLPTHDGHGMFPSSAGLQEQLWQFERHNPHRRKHVRRRSSIQRRLDEVEEEVEYDMHDERTARIEQWRLEQSKAVLEEITKETRRRRRLSRMSGASASTDKKAETKQTAPQTRAKRIDSAREVVEASASVDAAEPSESWWQRITRRVIRDLIGLDETTLSVIFGEELAADATSTPTQQSPFATAASQDSTVTFHDASYDWEVRLLERVARELGALVNQLSEHDGAFSSYRRGSSQSDYPYAGLAIERPQRRRTAVVQRRRRSTDKTNITASDALFAPTMLPGMPSPGERTDASLWGIEEEPSQVLPQDAASAEQDEAYWERDVDVKMIFSYLKRRFSPDTIDSTPAAVEANPLLPASWATTSASAMGTSPESARRAEIIRKQHPLVSRAAERAAMQAKRRESLLKRHQLQTLMHKRAGDSSCASQSTKRSRRSRDDSSRNYWDIGGSIGSVGSGPAMSSGLGGWGEI